MDENIVKHEYGHTIQERILGPIYISNIAIPSIIYCQYHNITNQPYDTYFSVPWERTAEWLGRAKNSSSGYKKYSLIWGIAENILGPIVIPYYFEYGY